MNVVLTTCFPGEVSQEKLRSVKTNDKMGVFKESKTCIPSKPEFCVSQNLNHYHVFHTLLPGIPSFLSWKHRTAAGPLQDVNVRYDSCSLSAQDTEALDGPFSDNTALPLLNKPGHICPNCRNTSNCHQTFKEHSPFCHVTHPYPCKKMI